MSIAAAYKRGVCPQWSQVRTVADAMPSLASHDGVLFRWQLTVLASKTVLAIYDDLFLSIHSVKCFGRVV
jgi:hypothetical protein